jgi:aspartate/methionine/tyrosine aminotransferase
MPRAPGFAPVVNAMRGGIFSHLAHRIAALRGEVYPLHVGDTWLEPMEGARMENFKVAEYPGMHRYSVPHGHPALLAAIEERHTSAGQKLTRDEVLVTAGATGGLGAVAGATLEPGDEVLVLSPYWPLIKGIVETAGGKAVEVPFFDRRAIGGGGLDVHAVLDHYLTPRTVALYVNSPNNPTGRVLHADEVLGLATFARRNALWIWADEVYERYAYAGPHASIRDQAPERTFGAYSFSKAYGMAGNRCGYVVGPKDAMLQVRKVATHSFYAAPTASQLAGAYVLRHGDAWIEAARRQYQQVGTEAAEALGIEPPEGGTFLFLDVAKHLGPRGIRGFLEDCLDDNLVLAPGDSCGRDYETFVRICFTAAPPDVVRRGVAVLAKRLGR